jgi:beta-lactamase regulating signal transducer with metallopeptidase domain
MNWEQLAAAPGVERLGWTLIHFVWQGAALGMALAAALWLARRRSPRARHALALGTLGLMLAAPVATFCMLSDASPAPARVVARAAFRPVGALVAAALPLASSRAATPDASGDGHGRAAMPGVQPSAMSTGAMSSGDAAVWPAAWREHALVSLRRAMPWLVLGWMMGSLVLAIWNLASWRMTLQLRRRMVRPVDPRWEAALARLAERMGIRRAVGLLESALVDAPSLVGWLRPVILLPVSALTGLLPSQIEAILAHELAHVRRHDYLVNLAQTMAETLLFYHPAVWRVGRRVRQEREHCCDDLAVAALGDARGYALALTRMAELSIEVPQFTMAMTGGDLMKRIRRLLGLRNDEPSEARWAAGALVFLMLAGCALVIPGCNRAWADWKTPSTAAAPKVVAASQATPVAPVADEPVGALKVTAPDAKNGESVQAAPGLAAQMSSPPFSPASKDSNFGALLSSSAFTPGGKDPGIVKFDLKSLVGDAKPTVNLDLDLAGIQMTLGAAGAASKPSDAPTTGAKQPGVMGEVNHWVAQADGLNLHQLRVLVYENLGKKSNGKEKAEGTDDAKAGEAKRVGANVKREIDRLIEQGWKAPVRIDDDGDQVCVLTRSDGARIKGVTVVVSDDSDLILANAAIDADATEVGRRVGSALGGALGGAVTGIATALPNGIKISSNGVEIPSLPGMAGGLKISADGEVNAGGVKISANGVEISPGLHQKNRRPAASSSFEFRTSDAATPDQLQKSLDKLRANLDRQMTALDAQSKQLQKQAEELDKQMNDPAMAQARLEQMRALSKRFQAMRARQDQIQRQLDAAMERAKAAGGSATATIPEP